MSWRLTVVIVIVVFIFAAFANGDFINDTVGFGFFSRQEEVAVGVDGDLFSGLASVLGQDVVEDGSVSEDLVRLNFNVADLTADTAVRLVEHDARIGQTETFAFGSARQQYRSPTGSLSHAERRDGTGHDLHHIVNRQSCDHVAARRVEVEIDGFLFVLRLQIKQFHNQLVGVAGVNLALQKDDPVFQQQVAQRHLTLTLIRSRRV